MKPTTKKTKKPAPLAVISATDIYAIPALRQFGIGQKLLRRLRRSGLKIQYLGRSGWVRGDELQAAIARESTDTRAGCK